MLRLLAFVLSLSLSLHLAAQSGEADIERLEARVAESDLGEERRLALEKRLAEMRQMLTSQQESEARISEIRGQLKKLPDQVSILQRELRREERAGKLENQPGLDAMDADALKAERLALEGQKTALEAGILQKQNDLELLRGLPERARQELATLDEQLADQLREAESGDGSSLTAQIRQLQTELSEQGIASRRTLLNTRLLARDLQMELIQLEMKRSERVLEQVKSRLEVVEQRIEAIGISEADAFRLAAEALLSNEPESVRSWAENGVALSRELEDLLQRQSVVREQRQTLSDSLQSLEQGYERTRQKIEVAGLSQALGQVLLEERRRLQQFSQELDQYRVEAEQIAERGLRQIELEDQRRKLSTALEREALLRSQFFPEAAGLDIRELREWAELRLNLLDELIDAGQSLLRELGEMDFLLVQVNSQLVRFRTLINERLLWVRSASALDKAAIMAIPRQLTELLNPVLYQAAWQEIAERSARHPLQLALVAILLVWWIRSRRQWLRSLKECAVPLRRLTTDNYWATLKAAMYSLLLCVPLPLVLYLAGTQLEQRGNIGLLLSALGPALQESALLLLLVRAIRVGAYKDGLMSRHFKWRPHTIDHLKLVAGRLSRVVLPIWFLSLFLVNLDFGSVRGGLPHLVIAVLMVSIAWSTLPVLNRFMESDTREWHWSVKGLRFFLIGITLVLGGAALSGYLYTAGTLISRLIETFLLLLVLVSLFYLVIRWLLLAQRRVAYRKALEKRAALRQKALEEKSGEAAEKDVSESQEVQEEPELDLEAVSKGARELLATALILSGVALFLWTWSEILPALGVLEDYALWQQTSTVEGETVLQPVTVLDLLASLLIIVITFLAARRLPALLEFILMHRLSLSSGGLYTIKTLSGYVIVAAGILMTFGSLGANWSQIQWMAAALSVGIGFGLQEIVANFISGLIILFERPIRVGDVVTVGDTDGVVTKIKIRATTIRNWDQKELLVPNKEFITGRLLNWTLSDSTTRIFLPVGIAYGSDVEKALDLIAEVVKNHPQVLEEPAASVFFESLGDNALILNVRCYVSLLEHRLPTISALHTDIYKRLNEAGIVIAFPQRDVHLDTLKPLEVRLLDRSPSEDDGLH